VPACRAAKTGAAKGGQRPRESSRSQAETARWLLSASRRLAARAWLALIEFGSLARPARVNAGSAGGVGAEAGLPGRRSAS
jgi:hypothetical protein